MLSLISTPLLADQIPDVSQKALIDKMHHKLHIDQAPFKAQEVQVLKEFNEMTILEVPYDKNVLKRSAVK